MQAGMNSSIPPLLTALPIQPSNAAGPAAPCFPSAAPSAPTSAPTLLPTPLPAAASPPSPPLSTAAAAAAPGVSSAATHPTPQLHQLPGTGRAVSGLPRPAAAVPPAGMPWRPPLREAVNFPVGASFVFAVVWHALLPRMSDA